MAIGPIRLLALPSYRSLTNQILIFAILDLNFSLNFDSMQAASSSCLLYYYVCGSCMSFEIISRLGRQFIYAAIIWRKTHLAMHFQWTILGLHFKWPESLRTAVVLCAFECTYHAVTPVHLWHVVGIPLSWSEIFPWNLLSIGAITLWRLLQRRHGEWIFISG